GSCKLSKAGTGILHLAGNNNYSGGLNVNEGTIDLGSNSAAGFGPLTLGNVGVFGGATLGNQVFLAGNPTFEFNAALNFAGPTTLTANRTVTVTAFSQVTFQGSIGQSGGSFKLGKTGAGSMILGGSNSFSGGVALSQGGLGFGNGSNAGTGPLTLFAGTIFSTGAPVVPNPVNLSGNITFSGQGFLAFTGPVTLTANRTLDVSPANPFAVLTLAGNIGGAFKLSKIGGGKLVLSGNNTFSGGLTVNGGVLGAGSDSAAGTGPLIFYGGAIESEGNAHTL